MKAIIGDWVLLIELSGLYMFTKSLVKHFYDAEWFLGTWVQLSDPNALQVKSLANY